MCNLQKIQTVRLITKRDFALATTSRQIRQKNKNFQKCHDGQDKQLLTSAASQIRHQGVSTVAAALVTTLRVGAESLTATVLNGTLVDV